MVQDPWFTPAGAESLLPESSSESFDDAHLLLDLHGAHLTSGGSLSRRLQLKEAMA